MRKPLLLTVGLLSAIPAFAEGTYVEWVNYSQSVMSVTVLALVAVVGTMGLHWMYRNRYKPRGGKSSFLRYAWQNALVKLGLFVVIVVIAINALIPNPLNDDSWEAVTAMAKERKMPRMAEKGFQALCKEFPGVVDYHFEYISAHYEQEEWASETGSVDIYVDEQGEDPKRYYLSLANDPRPNIQDIAKLGLGICCYYTGPRSFAMEQFRAIQDQDLPYQNMFRGRIHASWGELDSAEYYFKKEIALGDAKDKATQDWVWMMYAHQPDSLERIQGLIQDSTLGKYVPSTVKRFVYHQQSAIAAYWSLILGDWWTNSQWIGLAGALLGTLLWMFFLRRLDPGRQQPWALLILTFLGGAVFSFLALFLYDTVHFDLGLYFDGNAFGHDFLYCVFGIGVIEELVKIVPFLIVLFLLRRQDRPINYLLYASASALGFAFVENLIYFDASHVGIIHGRILVSVVFHMFATSTIAFAMMLGKFRYRRYQIPLFLLGFLAASFFHGFFDFWLMSSTVGPFMVITFAFFIYITFQYAAYLNNALNHTAVGQSQTALDPGKLAVFLTVGLVVVLLFEYGALGLVYGRSFANYSLLRSLGMGSFMMFFVVLNLSNIDVVQGEWIWLRLWDFGSRAQYNHAIGKRLRLIPKGNTGILTPFLPMDGEVTARVSLSSENPYFLFKLDHPIDLNGVVMEQLLLRGKKDGDVPEPNRGIEVIVVAYRDQEALKRKTKRKTDFKLLDTVIVS